MSEYDPADAVDAISLAWLRERPNTPVAGIGIVTRLWMCAKLLGEDRRRVLAGAGADTATLDLLSVLRRSGTPYRLTTREISERTGVTAGAISQRLAKAEGAGLVERSSVSGSRMVNVALTATGHALVEELVDRVLGREAELTAVLTEQQREGLTDLLRILLDGLQGELGDPGVSQVGA
ncbi:DNA-binding MarR family transcriptional regulator [Rhodococcus sp. 27YEA15]|uniref:MarR family winged helix-turn-helix transcriptional regulator n=1 Tax=Rhodococcus sp. 27YEA15 TaxID=3156259 RepID=UPI003C7ACB16